MSLAEILDPLSPVPPLTVRVRPVNDALLAILTKPAPLTAEEWAYVEACERAALTH